MKSIISPVGILKITRVIYFFNTRSIDRYINFLTGDMIPYQKNMKYGCLKHNGYRNKLSFPSVFQTAVFPAQILILTDHAFISADNYYWHKASSGNTGQWQWPHRLQPLLQSHSFPFFLFLITLKKAGPTSRQSIASPIIVPMSFSSSPVFW